MGTAAAGRLTRAPWPLRAFSSSLPMALLRARESVMRRFRPGLRDHGVTEQQWRILRALAGRAGLEITELASQTCLRPPSLSRILPDLEARGLVARRPVASDMRRAVVVVTRGGLELIAAHAPASERIYRAIEDRFGSERLRQLLELLGQLEDCVARAPAERRARDPYDGQPAARNSRGRRSGRGTGSADGADKRGARGEARRS